ncbi:CAP-associated domain-containing protein [Paraliobacillus sp. X-1268]|uniref:CAP domain-containing protein n=1 Tax=Paraliobacillus sp. X-1268 TaxID=2213193 RepID=UPI000E3DE749|nr:CAP-associated domain-containing protein [Paraliobacillus sp. X-1268]
MPKIRNIIFILLLVAAFLHFYGDTFNQSGFPGVYNEIQSDVNAIKENPRVISTVESFNTELQQLINSVKGDSEDSENVEESVPDDPALDEPTEQPFSIHNVEIGDDRSKVEAQVGEPKRSSMNEYKVNWVAYHEDYHNFFMAAYNEENKVIGLYTNQNLLTSTKDISFESTRDSVLNVLNDPLESIKKGLISYQVQQNQEYDIFLINDNYVTIFYDKHEDSTVTAIQIISDEMEQKREKYFGEASDALKEGFEYQLFDLTNAARVEHGLSVLSWEESVRTTARDHSLDMAENNYFSHTNLEGQSPFDRMTEDNISYTMAGENLAAGQPSSIFSHEGLMNSLGHRENILKTEFESLAVGVAFNEDSQPYYTENFITK